MLLSTLSLCAILVTKSHVRDAYADLFNGASAYDEFMNKRYAYIEQQKKNAGNKNLIVTVERNKNPLRILVYSDISRDKTDWRNSAYAQYFDLTTIVTKQRATKEYENAKSTENNTADVGT